MPVVQPQENTAGAPTTGLGQNVTFAFDAPGSAPQQQGGGESLMNDHVQGGDATGNPTQASYRAPPVENPTLDLLAKFGDSFVNQKLKEAKGRAFVSGMQKAMQGEAINDIVDEQPWYSRIFGQSDAVEGARQYLGNTRAQSVAIGMIDDMPNLRKLHGDAAQSYFNDAVQKSMTGDPLADGAIMQHFTSVLPTVMKQQVKENFAYKQETAAASEAASFKAGAANLQRAGSQTDGDIWSEADVNSQAQNFIAGLMPPQGRDFKSYQDSMMDNVINAAQAGQFHVLKALAAPVTDPATGNVHSFMDMFKPDQQQLIHKALERGANDLRTHGIDSYADQITQLDNLATHPDNGMTSEQLMDQARALNDKFQKQTGSPEGIFTTGQIVAYGHRAQDAIIGERLKEASRADAAARAATTQEQKATAQEMKNSTIDRMASTGDLYSLASQPGYSNDAIDSRVADSVNSKLTNGDTKGAVGIMTANFLKGTYVIKPLQDQLVGHVLTSIAGDAGPTSSFMRAYTEWKAIHDVSPDMAAAYYQKSNVGARMEQFDKLYTAGIPTNLQQGPTMPPAMAFSVFGKGWNPDPVDAKDAARAMKAVTSKFDSMRHNIAGGWLGGDSIRDDAAARLSNELGHMMKDYIPSAGVEGAASRALAVEMTTGKTSIIGEHVIMNQPPRQQTLESYFSKTGPAGQVAIPTGENIGTTFNDAVRNKLVSHYTPQPDGTYKQEPGIMPGDDATNVIVSRLPDTNGTPNFTIWASDKDGKVYQSQLLASDVWKEAANYRILAAKHKAELGTLLRTPGTSTADRLAHAPNIVGYHPNPN